MFNTQLFPGMLFLIAFMTIPACKAYEENFLFSVNKDGSAELYCYLHRFDNWGDNPPQRGEAVAKKYGFTGVNEVAKVPFLIEIVHAWIPDIGQFKLHDITFSKTMKKDIMELKVRIPIGKNTIWMKKYPLLSHRYSEETLQNVAKMMLPKEDQDDFDGSSKWLFEIDMPGVVTRREVKIKGKATNDIYGLDEEQHRETPHLLVYDMAFEIEEDAALIWTLVSRIR